MQKKKSDSPLEFLYVRRMFCQSLCAVLAVFCLVGCSGSPATSSNGLTVATSNDASPSPTPSSGTAGTATPIYTYTVVKTYPHDTAAFTEGLFYENDILYESTGLNGHSTLRQEELTTGKILKQISIPSTYFAEGITSWNGKIFQLTWQNQIGFNYDESTFEKTGQFTYTGEGWALTHDTKSLIMDDGSDAITFRDPTTFAIQRTIRVSDQGKPVTQLNELEYIKDEIFANVWMTNLIARIDPQTGNVNSWIDMTGIQPSDGNSDDVLNGIAYDAKTDRIFVTGKRWPNIFEITLHPKP